MKIFFFIVFKTPMMNVLNHPQIRMTASSRRIWKTNLLISIFLLFIPLITSIEIDMKTSFDQGETLIAKISGDFYEAISKEDIVFNRGHVRTSIIPFVVKINNDFYIYAQLFGKSPNDYSIILENVKYIQGNRIIEEDISKNFSITENFADFSINPGFIITDKDFFIEVKNLQDYEIVVSSRISDKSYESNEGFFASLFGDTKTEDSIILNFNETRKINFEVEGFEKFSLIELSNENLRYEIPVYISSKEVIEEKEVIEDKEEVNFRFEPSEIDVSIATNSETFRIIYLRNLGVEEIEDISLTVSDSLIPYVAFSIDEIRRIEGNSVKKIDVYFYSYDDEEVIEGQIIAISGEDSSYASVFMNYLKDYIPVNGEEIEEKFVLEKCSELNGRFCNPNQQCEGEIEYATDGVCCIGSCTEIKASSTGVVIGWVIIILIVISLIWFYFKRYKGVRGVSDLVNVLRKK